MAHEEHSEKDISTAFQQPSITSHEQNNVDTSD